MSAPLQIGLLVFPRVTQLDLTGPVQVFSSVPGGFGTDDMVNDQEMLDFLRRQAVGAKYITSVCTGSLVLGAAGLLRGYRATTHWTAMDLLALFEAKPTKT